MRITLLYLSVVCGWVVLSEWVLASFRFAPPLISEISLWKGCLFVAASAAFLYHLMEKHFTELDVSRAEVAANAQLFRTVFDLAGVGVALVDPMSGRFLEVNRALCRFLGYSEKELLSLTFQDLTHPDDLKDSLERMARLRVGESVTVTQEKRYLTKGGSAVPAHLTVSRMWADGEEPWAQVAVIQDMSAAKEAEAALVGAKELMEERFRLFMAHSPVAAWIIDGEGVFRYVSPTYYRMFDVPEEGLEGISCKGLYPPDMVECYLKNNLRVLESGAVVEVVEPVVLRDGSRGELLVYKFLLPTEDGEALIGGIAANITELRHAQRSVAQLNRELEQRVEELQLVLDTSPIGLAIARDPSGTSIRGNSTLERLLGVGSHGELSLNASAPAPYRVLRQGREVAVLDLPMQRASRGESVVGEMLEVVREDGMALDLYSCASPLWDPEGRPCGAVGAFLDLTESRRAEEALKQSAEQRRLALESAQLGAWDYHFGSGEVFWDERCRDMFGFSAGDRIDYDSAVSVIHPDDLPGTNLAVEQAIAGAHGGEYHREFRVVWPDGTVHWVASHGRVYFQGEGENRRAVRFVGVNLEITAGKEAEEELRLHRDHLDALVRERTLELAAGNEQLAVEVEQRKAAQQAKVVTIELLRLCNEAQSTGELVRELLPFFREHSGCEAIAVRLPEGEDFPHYATIGMEEEFLAAEKTLCARDEGGNPLPHATGAPLLECLCGMVLSGGTAPLPPSCRTEGGSFWTESASVTLSTLVREGEKERLRLRCLKAGYQSIALIPLVSQGEIFGLFQFCDRKCSAFSEEKVAFLETLVFYASIALAKLHSDEALRESARALREAQELARVGSYRYDFSSDRWTSSEILDEIFGIDKEYRRDRDGWIGLLHPDDREEVLDSFHTVLATRGQLDTEHKIVRLKDGEERWVHALGAVQYAEDGSPLLTVGTIQDVTQRKLSEQAQRESERRFRTLIEKAPVAIILSRGVALVYGNRKFEELFGYQDVEEIRGQSVGMLWSGECRDEMVERSLKRAMGLPVPTEYETMAQRRDGTLFPVQVAATTVLLADGMATIAFLSDVSERKEAENAVRRYTRRLMELEEDLRRDIAMELHDHIGQDLTALGLNLAYVGSTLKGGGSEVALRLEDSRMLTTEISRSVRSMMTALRPPQLDELGLAEAVRSHAELFSQRTGIVVEVAADPLLPRLSLKQESVLFRIVQEALVNVFKHAAAASVSLSLKYGEGMVGLTVADDGCGFSLSALCTGGGYGITIMRERAALIGAAFELKSRPGAGTSIAVEVREEL